MLLTLMVVVFLGSAAAVIWAGARYPNALGSWATAVVLVALPLVTSIGGTPSGLAGLRELDSYLPFASDLLLVLVGLSAIVVLDAAAARRHDRLQWAFWIGLVVSLATVAIALHWNTGLRAASANGATITDVSLVLSYVGVLLIISLSLRLATAED
ncbi:hypothetical protein [Salinarimonas ramus]|uniref:Uncharacterized protein n=1 Tax=Salinarimonas ramus TaxID=690164 RepID=A0A917Q3N5_9HYPH|nr:hypothetical protein [Salinarimonas ramus]GGK18136.1 hypothetical protein GCM10011322_01030 [Salinarimonas ramus]